jgi:hypothetical protein
VIEGIVSMENFYKHCDRENKKMSDMRRRIEEMMKEK